jgi:oligopeptidase B
MRFIHALGIIVVASPLLAAATTTKVEPPVAKSVPHKLELHGQVRSDEYYWLKERENPEVVKYLTAENEYTSAVMRHTEPLQEKLFQEFKTRIKQTDVSVPFRRDGFYYYGRTEDGKNYGISCRKKGSLEAPEEVILDVNQVCAEHKFCSVAGQNVSPDSNLLAYGIDTVGRRFYTLRVKDLRTGKLLADQIPDVTANVAWANDGKTLFYTKQDPETLRSYRIYRHVLGTVPTKDELVFEEKDDTFDCFVYLTKSKRYVMIVSEQTLSSEVRYIDAERPVGEFRVFLERERDHEYGVDHYGDSFYVRTNRGAKNFRLMKTPVTDTDFKRWTDVIPHRDDVFIEDFEIFRDYLVVEERKDGLLQLRVRPWSGEGEHYVEFGEPAYVASPQSNYEFDTPILRYGYASMTTPSSVYDYDMRTHEKKLLKRDEVLGGFDTKNYRTERIQVTARDGKKVPVSLVYRLPFTPDGTRPLLLYGYGSYGSSTDPGFDPFRISLLDRGFVFAIAHVRGGQELGRAWYEDGKLLHKKNTFTDFIDSAEHLVRAKYADPKRVLAWGGSAGGLLVGAVVTMRPDLWAGAIAEVPFVDVVTTMLDDDIPLTTGEFDEWGDPKKKEYYDYMLSYSPYDQTRPAAYPSLLVTTGLHDSQVQYWEPAKWVARLRAVKQDDHVVMLKTEMEAGHGGLTGRDDRYRERAFRYAYLLDVAGLGG